MVKFVVAALGLLALAGAARAQPIPANGCPLSGCTFTGAVTVPSLSSTGTIAFTGSSGNQFTGSSGLVIDSTANLTLGSFINLGTTVGALGDVTIKTANGSHINLTPQGTAAIKFQAAAILRAYTFATLPTAMQGAMAYITDAAACVAGVATAGGGAVRCKTWYDGTAWTNF